MGDATDDRTAHRAEWYLVLDGQTAGPFDRTSVEELWNRGEIDGATLAWRPGLSAWRPLDACDEARAWVAKEPGPDAAAVTWRRSDAIDLGALVSDELAGQPASGAPSEDSAQNPADRLGLPTLVTARHDPWFSAAPSDPSWGPAVPDEGEGLVPTFGWTPPRRPPRKPTAWWMAGAGGVLLVTATGLAAVGAVPRGLFSGWSSSTAPVASAAPVAPAPAPEPLELVPLVEKAPAPDPPPDPSPARKATPKVAPAPIQRVPPRASAPAPAPPPRRARREDTAARPPLKGPDIVAAVKAQAKVVVPCLKRARMQGELADGEHRLILNWKITPSGKTIRPSVSAPAWVRKTSIPACMEAKMRRWRFPISRDGGDVKNFPFGPFRVR